jgi:AraC-like DNA-binding protein
VDVEQRHQLSRGAELLARTDLAVKAISGEVGPVSRSSFTRAFIARHGAAPRPFRATAPGPAPALDGPAPRLAGATLSG